MAEPTPFAAVGRHAFLSLWVVTVAAWAGAAGPDQEGTAEAQQILAMSGVRGGLIVHLGCGDGRLTAALWEAASHEPPTPAVAGLRRPREGGPRAASDAAPKLGARSSKLVAPFLVQGLEADAGKVTAARQHIRALGLYGRVSVLRFDGTRLPYADNLANLVVVESPGQVPMAEVTRVLAPGGVACVKAAAGWEKRAKTRPDDIDDWTHYLHGADNNAVAMDTRVGPPRSLQWKSDPLWCRSHNGTPSSVALVLSARGRLFSMIDEGLIGQPGLPQRWTIVARDGFSGILLWKKRLAQRLPSKAIAAVGDRVYLAPGQREPLTILDAATGETLLTCKGTERADELVCTGNRVVLHVRGGRRSKDGKDATITAVDAEGGGILWQTPSKHIARTTLAAADGRVCFHNGAEAVCLDLRNGKELWRAPCKGSQRGGTLLIYRGAVLCSVAGGLRAFAADTGKPLWKGPGVHRRLWVFGASGLVWLTSIQEHGRTFLWTPAATVSTGYDPMTGEVKRTVTVSHLISPGHHIRCYPAKATDRYLLLPKRGVEFVDLQGENHMRHDWLRASCGFGVIAANGLLYAPPHQCFCYPGVKLTGFNALTADAGEQTKPAGERLVRGPAYGAIGSLPAEASAKAGRQSAVGSADEWPTYRRDARRSGAAGCALPVELHALWERELGGRLSQPVVADGRLLVAEEEAHTVQCLDAASGQPLWSYTADGRIDSPPTLYEGLVLFGSTDGWVYCLRASDGALAWRFRAAPRERRIVAFDQLESAWPVHGSVLVQKGIAYCTAGRSSFLDGGIWVYALEPRSGKVLHQAHLATPNPDVTKDAGRPFDMEGARSDLLVSDGEDLYMFFVRFAPDLTRKETPRITKLGDREVGLHLMSNAGFLDKAWFDRSYWTYGRRWPGYYFAYNAAKSGQILVFDETTTYGLHVFTTRQGHSPRFWPGKDGYELFADSNDNRLVLRPTAIGREKGNGYSRALPPLWLVKVPVRVQAMVLAGKHLFAAGAPDVVPQDDPYAAFEGRKGGRLWVVSTEDGKRLAEYPLDHPPVFDGMSAAGGRLYLVTTDGRLRCMGAAK